MTTPSYVRRFVRMTEALRILGNHPDGLRLTDLAAAVGASEGQLRAEIRAYYGADVPVDQLAGGYQEPVIEFVAALPGEPVLDDDAADPDRAAYVRLRDIRPVSDVGTRFLSLGELAMVTRTGHARLSLEPDNAVLSSALTKLENSVLSGIEVSESGWMADLARPLRRAAAERRRVRIVYASAWEPGVVERLIEPYQLLRTRRGWELDAAIPDRGGDIRTFLVSCIRSVEDRGDTFERPADVWERLAEHRRTRAVGVVVPHGTRWAVELYAESAELLEEDEESVKVRVRLLPPVERRLGLLLTAAGSDAFVVEPADLDDAGRNLALDLLRHHGPGGDVTTR